MKPTASRLLVRILPEVVPEKSKEVVKKDEQTGNIPLIMPTVKGNTVLTANVIDTGPLVKEVSKGDKVIFSPYGFDEVTLSGEKLVIVQEDMILAYENHGKDKRAGR